MVVANQNQVDSGQLGYLHGWGAIPLWADHLVCRRPLRENGIRQDVKTIHLLIEVVIVIGGFPFAFAYRQEGEENEGGQRKEGTQERQAAEESRRLQK